MRKLAYIICALSLLGAVAPSFGQDNIARVVDAASLKIQQPQTQVRPIFFPRGVAFADGQAPTAQPSAQRIPSLVRPRTNLTISPADFDPLIEAPESAYDHSTPEIDIMPDFSSLDVAPPAEMAPVETAVETPMHTFDSPSFDLPDESGFETSDLSPPVDYAPATDGSTENTWIGDEGGYAAGCDSGCSDASCDSCGTSSILAGSMLSGRRTRIYGGVEWLYAKPRFSRAVAFTRFTSNIAAGNTTQENVYSDFERNSSFRARLGLQSRTCGNDVRFTFSQFDSTAQSSTFVGDNVTVLTTDTLVLSTLDETLVHTSQIRGRIFDLDFGRSVAAGGCDGCPPWNLRFSAGARIADWEFDSQATASVAGTERSSWDFRGAGPQIGFEGRRFFNGMGNWSLFGSFYTAVLLGEIEFDQSTATRHFSSDVVRAVPVTELQLGARWMLNQNAAVNLGWSQQVWWDLAEEINGQALDAGNLAWDGLGIGVELSF